MKKILAFTIVMQLFSVENNSALAISNLSSAADVKADTSKKIPKDTSLVLSKKNIPKKNQIETTVKYSAKDSIRFDVVNKIVRLYGDASFNYGKMSLLAARIEVNWATNQVKATGVRDSTGKLRGRPVFKENGETYELDEVNYNFKSKKGYITGAVTKQGDGYVVGEKIKKMPNNEMFVKNGHYTTCDKAVPHFGIRATKLKMIPGKTVIAGPGYMHVHGVPTPLVFPLGYFPMPKSRASGILIPGYAESQASGFYLERLGLYWAINDYMGFLTTGDIYSNGSLRTSSSFDYKKRYRYSGLTRIDFSDLASGFYKQKVFAGPTFWLTWQHNQVPKGANSGRFSANVSAGASNFNRQTAQNVNQFIQSTFTSSVNYSKQLGKTPFNISVSVNHNQNVNTKMFTMEAPNMSLNMNTQRPFKKIVGTKGPSWLRELNIGYSSNFKYVVNNTPNSTHNSSILTYNRENIQLLDPDKKRYWESRDTIMRGTYTENIKVQSLDTFRYVYSKGKYGLNHSIPINTTLKVFKHFSLNPNFNLTVTNYDRNMDYDFANNVDTSAYIRNRSNEYMYVKHDGQTVVKSRSTGEYVYTIKEQFGLKTLAQYSTGANVTSRVYGTYFPKIAGIEAIRHTVVPTVGFTYRPDQSRNPAVFQTFVDRGGIKDKFIYLSRYGSDFYVFGAPTGGKSYILSYSLDNVLDMKYKNSKDTTGKNKFKKVKLIDNFGISGTYNFGADSSKLSPIAGYFRTNLFNIFNINITSIHNPYQFKPLYQDINKRTSNENLEKYTYVSSTQTKELKTNWKDLNIESFNFNISASFTPWKSPLKYLPSAHELAYYQLYPHMKYVDFKMPWTLSVSGVYNYTKKGFDKRVETKTMNFSGDVKIASTWKISITSGYDFSTYKITTTSYSIHKDLHCWEMSMGFTPFQAFSTFQFRLNVKAGSLKDLKIPKNGNGVM